MHPHSDLNHDVAQLHLTDLRRDAEQTRLLRSISVRPPFFLKIGLPLTHWTLSIYLTTLMQKDEHAIDSFDHVPTPERAP